MPGRNGPLHYLLIVLGAVFLFSAVSSCSFLSNVKSGEMEVPLSELQTAQDTAGITEGCTDKECVGTRLLEVCSLDEPDLNYGELREVSQAALWEARGSFLLGLFALEEARPGALGLIDRSSVLTNIPDYVLFYRAAALRQLGRNAQAVEAYDTLVSVYPDSALKAETLYQRAVALMGAADYTEAKKGFDQFTGSYPGDPLAPDALLKSAFCSFSLNDLTAALKQARRILALYPTHPASQRAASLVEGLRTTYPKEAGLTDEERSRRAQGFFDAARFNSAITELALLLKDKNGPFYDWALLKTAKARMRLKQYDSAEKTLKQYLSMAHPLREPEALYMLSQVAVRQGKEAELKEAQKRFSKKFSSHPMHARVLMLLGGYYESHNKPGKASEAYSRVIKGFKDGAVFEDALWARGWMAYKAGRFKDAYTDFILYPQISPRGKNLSQFLYWAGRSAERMGGSEKAIRHYYNICAVSTGTYYCRLAELRTGAGPAMPDGGQMRQEDLLDDENDPMLNPVCTVEDIYGAVGAGALATASCRADDLSDLSEGAGGPQARPIWGLLKDPHYMAARELVTLGLNARAAAELNILTRRYSNDTDSLLELAGLFKEAGDFNSALRIYYRTKAKGPADELQRLAFPPQVLDSVRRAAGGCRDPYLVAAIMREESEFDPNAVSSTGALGLMQIMPATGRFIAKEAGRDGFDPKELFDPEVNIELGALYLDHLKDKFNGDIVLTIAGYNAGPYAASSWAQSLPPEPDEFIESIPYQETRSYTKRVLKSYYEFMRISGEKTRPALKLIRTSKPARHAQDGQG